MIKAWIEAMRLRTLPVSIAGVITAGALNRLYGTYLPGVLAFCLMFAVLAQISSNFANEYFDYRNGLDKPGRVGPRRGVTEGDISPRAMLIATCLTLALACADGLLIAYIGGWWLIALGILIAVGVFAYSAGPYPFSQHGLGEVAVIFFFGIIPVNLTFYVSSGCWNTMVALSSVAIGLMGANVLIVNNYRDADADKEVGKHTLAVLLGRTAVRNIYLLNGIVAILLMAGVWIKLAAWSWIPVLYLLLHIMLWRKLGKKSGSQINPLLGQTAILMLAYSVLLIFATKVDELNAEGWFSAM